MLLDHDADFAYTEYTTNFSTIDQSVNVSHFLHFEPRHC